MTETQREANREERVQDRNLIPFKPGDTRARIMGQLGGRASLDAARRRKALVEALQAGLDEAVAVSRAPLAELVGKLQTGRKLSRSEQSDLRWWAELLARHCKGVVPQLVEIMGLVGVVEIPRLPADERAALRERWRLLQAAGLVGEDGLPVGEPEDYLGAEATGEAEE